MTGTTSQLQPADGGLGAELSYDEQIERWEIAVRTAFEQGGEPRFFDDINRFDLPVSANTMISASISLVLACAAFHELDGLKLSDFLARQALSDQTSQETSYRLLFQFHDGEVGVVVADRGLCLLDLAELYDISLQGTGSIGFMGFWVVRPDGKDLDASEIEDLERAITCDIYFDYCDEEVCVDFDESWPGALFCSVRDCCG